MTGDVSPGDRNAHNPEGRILGGACSHQDAGRICNNAAGVRHYLTGNRCPMHTPAALAGRPDTRPDPELTLAAVAARAGRPLPELGPLPMTPREGAVHAARQIRKPR